MSIESHNDFFRSPDRVITSEIQALKQSVQWKVMENLEFLQLPSNDREDPMTEEEVRLAYERWIEFNFSERFSVLFERYYFGDTFFATSPIHDKDTLVARITSDLKMLPTKDLSTTTTSQNQ